MTISAGWLAPERAYVLSVDGLSTSPQVVLRVVSVALVVLADSDFAIWTGSTGEPQLTVQRGQCGDYPVAVFPAGNFTAPVTLTLVNAPTHVDWQFVPNGTAPQGGGVESFFALRVCAKDEAVPGNYTVTISGTSLTAGPITHTSNMLLRVLAPPPPLINPFVYLVVVALLLVALGIALAVALLSKHTSSSSFNERDLTT